MPTGSPGQPSATRRLEPPWACGCGRFSTDWPASKAKHLMACDGTPPLLSGRIAARGGAGSSTSTEGAKQEPRHRITPVATKARKAPRRATRPRKAKSRALAVVATSPLVIPVGASARLTFLDQARAARDRLDVAIAAIEALG